MRRLITVVSLAAGTVIAVVIGHAQFKTAPSTDDSTPMATAAPERVAETPPAIPAPAVVTDSVTPVNEKRRDTARPGDESATADVSNRVIRALITDSMRGNVPGPTIGAQAPLADTTRKFYFYTELQQPAGKRFAHVWEYNGKTVARIDFKPRTNPWSASSSKKIPAHMKGAWRATLVDENGMELASVPLVYGVEAGL